MSVSKTFCIYPWDHLATLTNGNIVPCCVAEDDQSLSLHNLSFQDAWNSNTMMSIRKQMLNGQKAKACNRCFIEEESGIQSHRIQSNEHYKSILKSFDSLILNTNSDGFYNGPIKSIDLRLGNNCNLKCVMCRPAESTKWAAEINQMLENTDDTKLKNDFSWKSKINKSDYEWYKTNKFWDLFQSMIPDMREIIIGGGEPFLIKEQIEFLNECVKRDHAKNLKIRFHTNGTILLDEVIETLNHFKQIEMMVSIDGLAEKNYYMRYPANWETICKNLDLLDKTGHNVMIYILSTMHAMSIFYFPDFLKWFMNKSFKKVALTEVNSNLPITGIVHNPSYINPRVLPNEIKKIIRQKYNQMYENEFKHFFKDNLFLQEKAIQRFNANLDYMDSESMQSELTQFNSYIQTLDKTRKTSFSKIFPEMADLLKF